MRILKILLGTLIAIGIATLFCYGIYKIALLLDRVVKITEETECLEWAEQKEQLPDLWVAPEWQISQCSQFSIDLK